MAIKFVDNSLSTGLNNGTSWPNAWHALSSMTGLVGDDIVEISGGPNGGAGQTYSFSDVFPATFGTAGHPITYRIGQDSSHNGQVTFNQTSQGFSNGAFVYTGCHDIIISGDAGDGVKHFLLSGTFSDLLVMTNGDKNVRVSYFDLGSFAGELASCNASGGTLTGVEIDHIDLKISGYPGTDRAIYMNPTGSTYADCKIHHLHLQLPRNPSNNNYGPDGIQGGGSGVSVYNNTIESYVDLTLTTTQHMDGWQPLGGSYFEAYNNAFVDMTNYGMYFEAAFAVFNHVRIYNNIVYVTNSTLGTNSSGGIVVEQKFAGTFNDIVVANNTIVDLNGGSRALTFLAHYEIYASEPTNCYLYNNSLVNSNGIELDPTGPGTGPTLSTNVITSAANAATYFNSYTTYGGLANNMRLTVAASSALKTGGTDASSFGITTDWSGAAYANPPSVGAFQFSGSAPSPTAGNSPFLSRQHSPSFR